MDHDAFLAVIREQSERFLEALKGVPADAPVPSCDGWSADDLLWHLAEVQHFWAEVAAGAPGDDIVEPPRPKDVAELRALGARSGTELLSALASRGGSTPCWSWHPDGGTLRWVARRQAHEALVHRADAQLTAGLDVRPPSVELAVDGGRTSRPAVSCASARCTSASCACRRATHRSVPPSGCQDQHGVDPPRDASALSSSVPERAPSARSSATSLGRDGSTMSSPGAPAATSAQKCCTSARCHNRSSADQPSQEGTGASAWTPVSASRKRSDCSRMTARNAS